MSKKYIYDKGSLLNLLGKKSEKEETEKVNHCLIEGRRNIVNALKDNPRHENKIKHYNKVIKALPEEKLAQYIKAFILMDKDG